ncbi:MAG: ShlB/FhaC/HecB family hemolysin secretion/activation protein [Leptodesmis sp.]|uniref:ShlB/FhaC/HecB family hemolysin secretion/activation protein n=1 Tax=Leptodesmis sp. TaxID=3100501 RepID=UPI003D0D050A
MPIFTPPPSPPSTIELAQPRYGVSPVILQSHGYRYVVTGNTLLPPALIRATIASAATPKVAIGALLKAYHRSGYALVAIKGQVVGTSVGLAVFQGLITTLKSPASIRPFFGGLQGRDNVRKPEIIQDQILADTFASRSGNQTRVNISPAPNPDGTDLTINQTPIAGYSMVSGALTFGNYGSRYSSGYLVGADVVANLTHGIQITGNFSQGLPGLRQISSGSNYYQNGVGASIVTPYGIYGFSTSWTHYRLGKATYPLNPDGNVFTYQFTGSQFIYADTATRVSVNEALNHVRYGETVFNGYYTLLNQHYNYLTLGGSVDHSLTIGGRTGNLSGSLNFNLGISGPSGTLYDNVPGVPTSHFRYTDLTLGYTQQLPYGFQANLNGQAQWSVSTLPAGQQWVLGGLGTLSAWEPGVVAADSGYLARLQIDAPEFKRFGGSARFGVFLETGGATFTIPSPGTAPWQTLSDAGVSLKLQLPHGFSATAMAATPIQTNGFSTSGETNLRSNRLDVFFVVQKGF